MYERNINVLEMFIEKKLGYVETNNIKNNYYDYKELVKVLDDYINICNEEIKANQEYNDAVSNIQNIQNSKEKLYNQNIKFEYSRNMLFSDVNRKVEDIEKCLVKIETALDKNKDTFKTLRQDFIKGIINLNEKSRTLKQIARPKNKIETDYNDALSLIKENFYAINPDDIELTKKFIETPAIFEEELIQKMIRNGKDEKVPFNEKAITLAAKLGLDIAKKEAENYLFMYEQTAKILNEIENDKIKLEARKKHITDVNVKLNFLKTEKEYLGQFLDNERVTAIQGEEEHDKIMKICCKSLKEDVLQINNLYELILKETKRRATNKFYAELYNKSYLDNIQEKEQDFINKTNNMDCSNGTVISPNYWRIDSIKAIYENFDQSVFETYGRKFVVPKEESLEDNAIEEIKTAEKPKQKIEEQIVEPNTSTNEIVQKFIEPSKEIINAEPLEVINESNDSPIIENEQSVETPKKQPIHFTKVKKINQIIQNEDNISENDETQENEVSTTENELIQENENEDEQTLYSEPDEIADLESILKEAKAHIASRKKKINIIKKMMKKNNNNYADAED